MGFSFGYVPTNSMEPTIKVDTFIINHEKDDYQVGDIITFYYDINEDGTISGNERVVHRIVDIVDGKYQTKGDNPNAPIDKRLTNKDNVLGKLVFQSSIFGKIMSIDIFSNKAILFPIIIILLIIMIVSQFVELRNDKKESLENENKNIGDKTKE